MSMVCLPVITTMRTEKAMPTAKAANAGADRGHSLRTSAPGRNTVGRPRSRNHRSAARRCAASAGAIGVSSPCARSWSEGTVAGYFGSSPRLTDMQRIIGTEVEYGISSPSDPTANPILTSTQAVLAYSAAAGIQRAKRTRWDYEVESPLRDARGFDPSRSAGPPPVGGADRGGGRK